MKKYIPAIALAFTLWVCTSPTGMYAAFMDYDSFQNQITAAAAFRYTITFDANGGSGTMENLSMVYGTEAVLPAVGFTKDGFDFDGWNTASDGSGTSFSDQGGVNNLSSRNGDIITFYAQWKEISGAKTGDFIIEEDDEAAAETEVVQTEENPESEQIVDETEDFAPDELIIEDSAAIENEFSEIEEAPLEETEEEQSVISQE